ncbi:MAG: ABC transporter [Candidatus Vogelbacteria bacterium RIFOXYD1_FULL_46_19]|uniref:ABC transporter n=1 Tax=Candidatus Vogelbacteria bacterium RIFOXYD1_FULL_46_19 TaxID=1802439 RepID=A0A1G2QH95_9BACT|nr:MAG: ABC transporter [Candidatus Vogelbacteria bacterium RIFOXYD1_FULL_46_19]
MIEVTDLTKNYTTGPVVTKVLQGINLFVPSGEFLSIMGKSGAGKSTLLYQMSLLDLPSSGRIIIDGVNTADFSDKARMNFRLNRLGYVFQDYALLPELSAVENVIVPLLMQGLNKVDAYARSIEALDAVGLAHRHDNRPSQLSGGEQQRVSISRAIAQKPDILFADEPTANLDSTSGQAVIEVMNKLHAERGQTIVMVTHELEYAREADRIIYLEDGQISGEEKQSAANH